MKWFIALAAAAALIRFDSWHPTGANAFTDPPRSDAPFASHEWPIRFRFTRARDADTFLGTIDYGGWGLVEENIWIRAADYDALETSRRRRSKAAGEITDEEIEKGKRARRETADYLAQADAIYIVPRGIEAAYGRRLAIIIVDPAGPDGPRPLADWIEAKGFQRESAKAQPAGRD